METETSKTETITPRKVSSTGAVEVGQFSTGDLAQRLAQTRIDGQKKSSQQATADSTATASNEGQAGDEDDAQTDLSNSDSGDGVSTQSTEGDGDGEGVTDGTDGDDGATADDASATDDAQGQGDDAQQSDDGEGEALDLTKVPKLTDAQARHVGELFKQRIGAAKKKYAEQAEQAVSAERQLRESAEAEVQQLRAEMQNQPVSAGNEIPLGSVANEQQLNKAVHDAQSVKMWASQQLRRLDRNPDGVKAAFEELKIELPDYSPEAMEDWLLNAQDRAEQTITIEAPRRAQFLKDEATANAQAEKIFPWLKDAKSKEYTTAMGVLRTMPEMKRLPHWKFMVGVYTKGLLALQTEQAATAKTNGKAATTTVRPPKPPKVTTRPSTTVRPGDAAETKVKEATAEFEKTGSVESLAKTFASKRT